jgi:hypothetical protein
MGDAKNEKEALDTEHKMNKLRFKQTTDNLEKEKEKLEDRYTRLVYRTKQLEDDKARTDSKRTKSKRTNDKQDKQDKKSKKKDKKDKKDKKSKKKGKP